MSHLHRNIIANIIGRLFNILSIYLFIPLYIHILGIEQYGLIAFFVLLQSLMAVADLGLSATLQRQFALDQDNEKKYKLLRYTELIYVVMALCVAVFFIIGAEYICLHWLKTEDLPYAVVIKCMRYMGIAICLQVMSTIYVGGLLGLERQVLANVLQVTWGLVKSGLVIVVLFFFNSIEVFFLWQIFINLLFVFTLRYFIHRALHTGANTFHWDFTRDILILKNTWKFAGGIIIIGLISSVVSQFDKLVVSKYLPLSELGIYTLAGALAVAPIVLANPLAVAVYPRFTYLLSRKETPEFDRIFRHSFKIIAITSSAIAITIALYSKIILVAWTHNAAISGQAQLVASVLVLGQLCISLQVIPYYLALAKGDVRINILVGSVGLAVLSGVVLIAQERNLMAIAVGISTYHLLTTVIYIYLVIRKHTLLQPLIFIFKNAVFPLVINCVILSLFYACKPLFASTISDFVYIGLTVVLAFWITSSICFQIRPLNIIAFFRKEIF